MQKPPSEASSVRYLTISADQAGQRIDNFLLALARSVPKSHIYRIIRTGQVRVNSGRIKPTYKLKQADSVRVPPMTQAQREQVAVPDALVSALENGIIFEDDELIVLNKPPGIAVHGGSGVHFGVIEALRQSRAEISTKLELIHRLDRGTSGCLLVGKSRQSTLKFQQVFRQRNIAKRYTALLMGEWPEQLATVDLPLKKSPQASGKRMVEIAEDGKEAVSHFSRREVWGPAEARVSLMDIHIDTGRTHQIRVHSAAKGHPVAGDDRYCDTANLRLSRQLGLKRLFLHCTSLEIKMGIKLDVAAPTDPGWQATLERLRKSA